MFAVSIDESTAIQKAFDQSGESAAAVELRRYFPIQDNAKALNVVRAIVQWKPGSEQRAHHRVRPSPV